jgi:hypothetical protein
MYFTATSRAAASADDLNVAQSSSQYGEDWKSLMRNVLSAAAAEQSVSKGSGKTGASPRRAAAAASSQQGPAVSPRRREAAPFPAWSVHTDKQYRDNFDSLRTNQDGICLHDAKKLQLRLTQAQIVRPNVNGAIIVPNSPRNGGAAVVIVDSDVAVNPNGVHPIFSSNAVAQTTEMKRALLPPRDERYNWTTTKLVQYLSSPR